jgi:hypothetical protein
MFLSWAVVLAIAGAVPEVQKTALPSDTPQVVRQAAAREPARDPAILAAFWELLGHAQYGFSEMEQGAFIICDDEGKLSLLQWPMTGRRKTTGWRGAVPQNAIGVVHTHPNATPKPSLHDAQTAIAMRMPVYVLTRSSIMKTSGGVTDVIVNRPWKHLIESVARVSPSESGAAK